MIKIFFLVGISSLLAFSKQTCSRKDILKGRLEIKGTCSNYTIKILQGHIDTSHFVREWKDEQTGKTYTNVFALGSPCTFPDSLREGEEFYFMVDSAQVQKCMVCMAYYPKPPKSLRIKVIPPPGK